MKVYSAESIWADIEYNGKSVSNEFVRYEDIKHLLERYDNSDYAVTASPAPKLPSLDDVLFKCPQWAHAEDIEETYEAIKKLGNFG